MLEKKKFSRVGYALTAGALISACAHRPSKNAASGKPRAKTAFQTNTLVGTQIRTELDSLIETRRLGLSGTRATIPPALPGIDAALDRNTAQQDAPKEPAPTNVRSVEKSKTELSGSLAKIAETIDRTREETKASPQALKSNQPRQALIPTDKLTAKPAGTAKPRIPVLVNAEFVDSDLARSEESDVTVLADPRLRQLNDFKTQAVRLSSPEQTQLIFELPVTYNDRVRSWIRYFQSDGRVTFRTWLERSARWMPYIRDELEAAGLPQDLAYIAMIESGFSPSAVSPAHAVGMWQFIRATANRYGLRTDFWIDERRDVFKSTRAAIRYISDLYRMFGSWYLVAASYNMGENGVQRLIKKYGSNDFWELADLGALPDETTNYVPKILAAMLIAKGPALYGFRDLRPALPLAYEYYWVPGGTDLINLASYLGVSGKYLQELNPEVIKGFIPQTERGHRIRIPKGAMMTVSQYVKMQAMR